MTREIKFRGKATHGNKKGQWVYGSYIKTDVDAPAIVFGDGEQCEIDPKTLGQATGLKDYVEKDLWEGDLVVPEENPAYDADEIVFEDGMFMIEGHDMPLNHYIDNTLLVGNIHDNPDLIGGGA